MQSRNLGTTIVLMGLLLTVVLFGIGGFALEMYSSTTTLVTGQLTQQDVFFPPSTDAQLNNPQIGPYIRSVAGQQVTTGGQAELYADHYLAVLMSQVDHGLTYTQVAAALRLQPNNTELANDKETLFTFLTLKSLLLEAYAFDQTAQITFYAAIALFVAGCIMLCVTLIGYRRLRPVSAPISLETAALPDPKNPHTGGKP